MENLKTDFEKWLINVKKYKTSSSGKSKSADFYKSKINRVCKNLYQSANNDAWIQLATEILPILIFCSLHRLNQREISAKQKQEIYDFLLNLRSKEILENSLCLEILNNPETGNIIFSHKKIETSKIKKALFLYYEFLKQTLHNESDYIKFDEIIQNIQNFCDNCDNTVKFLIDPASLTSPQEIKKEKLDTDYINEEQASKLTGISKTTLFEMAKKGLIKSYGSQAYSVDSLNEYFKNNHHIAEDTKNAGISSTSSVLFSSKRTAKELGCDESTLNYYRNHDKLSYTKKSPGEYFYFPDDVKRFKRERNRKKRVQKRIKQRL